MSSPVSFIELQATERPVIMNSTGKIWISRILKGIITLALIATAAMKIMHTPKEMVDTLMRIGIPESAIVPIAAVELTCLALYLIPRTTVLGAILLTGYFGGAIVAHIIGHESIFPVFFLGVMVWGGIYFRVDPLTSLIPLRREVTPSAGATQESGIPPRRSGAALRA